MVSGRGPSSLLQRWLASSPPNAPPCLIIPPAPHSEQDVWSLGVVLFAAVAGFLPFHSSTGDKKELCNKIIEGR